MSIISRFAGIFDAWQFAYGINSDAPVAIQVLNGSNTAGTYTITCQNSKAVANNGVSVTPSVNASITIGFGTNEETVTPTSVTTDNLGNLFITATFANPHSAGDQVRSGTYGLQEAVNAAAAVGGGQVVVDGRWALGGGTTALITALALPTTVEVADNRTGGMQGYTNIPASVTALAAPTALSTAAATNGLITTAATGGTISNATYRLGVTYVDAFGGETTLSVDTASTATIATTGTTSTISVTSPAAETGAVGYRVYMTAAAGATLTEILYPVGNAAITGTAVSGAALPCFAIGTPVTINAIITGTAKVPAQNSAYSAATAEIPAGVPVLSYPPFTALGTIAAAATGTVGQVNLGGAGFLNTIGRTVRFKGMYYVTTNGTAGTVTTELILASVYGVTSITPFAAASASIAASVLTIGFNFDITMVTAATGATGTLECHGVVDYNIAGTAVGSVAMDSVIAVSSTIDLTKQLTLSVAHLNTTAGTTASQLRLLTIEVLQ